MTKGNVDEKLVLKTGVVVLKLVLEREGSERSQGSASIL